MEHVRFWRNPSLLMVACYFHCFKGLSSTTQKKMETIVILPFSAYSVAILLRCSKPALNANGRLIKATKLFFLLASFEASCLKAISLKSNAQAWSTLEARLHAFYKSDMLNFYCHWVSSNAPNLSSSSLLREHSWRLDLDNWPLFIRFTFTAACSFSGVSGLGLGSSGTWLCQRSFNRIQTFRQPNQKTVIGRSR